MNTPGDGVVDGQETTNPVAASMDLKFKILNQSLGLNWDFAKRNASYGLRFSKNQFLNQTKRPTELSNGDIISSLASGTSYSLSHDLNYRLTTSTDLRFRYSHSWDKFAPDGDPRGDSGVGNYVDDSDNFETWVTTRF